MALASVRALRAVTRGTAACNRFFATRSIVCEDFGGPEVLQVGQKELPAPGDGQVLVQLGAAGVNPSDTYVRLGPKGPWGATPHLLPKPPFTPGKDGAGVVVAAGSGAAFKAGDRVYTLNSVTGTYADSAICNSSDVFALPAGISYAAGACVGVPCSTAYRGLVLRCGAKQGDFVFVHGASGAVGLAAVQLAKDLGCFVAGSAGTPAGREAVKAAGADLVLDHKSEGYLAEGKAATEGGKGFDICLEMMASSNLVSATTVMRRHGRIGIIGSKPAPIGFNPRLTMPLELEIRGVFSSVATPEERIQTQAALYEAMSRGALSPVVGMALTLEDTPKAHVEVMAPSRGGALGNIVLTCTADL